MSSFDVLATVAGYMEHLPGRGWLNLTPIGIGRSSGDLICMTTVARYGTSL
jgi:hypothetical protein